MYGGRVGIAGLVCALAVLAGCGSTTGGQSQRGTTPVTTSWESPVPVTTGPTSPDPPPVPITTSDRMAPKPKARNVIVSGVARGPHGAGVGRVLIGFRRTTCSTCTPMVVTTGQDGSYRASMPAASYVVACVADPYVCTVQGSEELSATVTIRSDETLDMAVQVGDLPHTSQPPTDTDPVPPATTSLPPTPGNGYAVWGHVLTNEGLPVPHITIQLIPPHHVGQTIFGDTVTDGSYGLAADNGVFTIVCITPNPDYECGPTGSDGNPHTVDIADGPQRVEFILCRSEDYPGCLSR